MKQDHIAQIKRLGYERHAYADLLSTLLNGVSHQAVNADRSEQQRRASEDNHEQHIEILASVDFATTSSIDRRGGTGKPGSRAQFVLDS